MSTPSSPLGFLPLDLVLLILAKLPIKALLRSRSVCKAWYVSLSSLHFAHLHFLHSSTHPPSLLLELPHPSLPAPSLLSLDAAAGVSDLSLDFLPHRVKIRASSCGLLCCASLLHRGLYFVCNPLTHQFRSIPRTREHPFSRFHPDCEATLVGLAFDPRGSSFRAVLAGFHRAFGRRPDERLLCQVFDSRSDAWRRFASPVFDEFTHMNRNQAVYSDGMLHWLTHCCLYVLALDLENESWRKIMLPDEIVARGCGSRVYLLDYEGMVSVIRMSGASMSIWVLEDPAREQWVLAERVNLGCIGVFAASAFPVCQSRDVVFLATQKMVLTYGRRSREWKVIYTVNFNITYPLWFSAHPFKATLFSCH